MQKYNLYTLVLPIIPLQCEMAFSRQRTMAVIRPLKQQVTQHIKTQHKTMAELSVLTVPE